MKVLLVQLDGKLPNLALMRISAHRRALGDEISIAFGCQFEHGLFETFDRVYASAIFKKTMPLVDRLLDVYPRATIGGTGYHMGVTYAQPRLAPTWRALKS